MFAQDPLYRKDEEIAVEVHTWHMVKAIFTIMVYVLVAWIERNV